MINTWEQLLEQAMKEYLDAPNPQEQLKAYYMLRHYIQCKEFGIDPNNIPEQRMNIGQG